MNFNNRPLIITDLETTGLDPAVHSIIEIGALKVDQNTLTLLDVFESKVYIGHHERSLMTAEAQAINGYSQEAWLHARSLPTIVSEFAQFAKDGVLVSQNVCFEYGFLREAFRKTAILDTMDYHRLDLPSIVWFMYPELNSLRLTNVAPMFGIPEEPVPHRALTGAEYVWKILGALSGLKPSELKVH